MSSFIPQKVNVVLSIDEDTVKYNIQENLNNINSWFCDLFYPNGYEAIIVSAGPSMEKYVEELNLKERMGNPSRDFVVFCVKHALPRLIKMGIEPDFCVILDGRPFEEKSTHGKNRKKLFERIPDKTIFLVASMSNPGYAKYLNINGARVLGWHTAVSGLESFQERGLVKGAVISGGTSSGTRAISLANAMGMRDITLVGFDSCIHEPSQEDLQLKDQKGRQKYIPTDLPILDTHKASTKLQLKAVQELSKSYEKNGLTLEATVKKRFYTTGELLAQAQDFEGIFGNTMYDMKFTVLDDGIVNHMFKNMPNRLERGYDFLTYIKNKCPRKNTSLMPKRSVTL